MKYGFYVTTIFFLIFGLIFTVVSEIFSFVNVCHTPVELIYGVDGLFLWNLIACLSYFLAMVIYGADFASRNIGPISDFARPQDSNYQWETSSRHLGYSYWLIFVNFFLHGLNSVLCGYYVYKRYKPRQKNREIGVDSSNVKRGTSAMIF